MGGFIDAALGFPAVLFSFLLVVVVGYWGLVLVGGADLDLLGGGVDADGLDGDAGDAGEAGGLGGFFAWLGFGGVPVTVIVSLLVAFAWFASLAGTVALGTTDLNGGLMVVLSLLVVVVALILAFGITRVLAGLLSRIMPVGPQPSRGDFMGATCVIRTGSVTATFGQAEVHAVDGSSSIIQVRQPGDEKLRAGSKAIIYDFDADGEFFWVMPAESAGLSDRSA
ncbi:OB-fold-containig protein [Catenuloplanes atrovinosus]|nr:OB-fold-containig protein [Catenuloplanes atrovinosus]